MKVILNQILEIGVTDPVVRCALVKGDKITTSEMHLADANTYVVTEICSVHLPKGPDDLTLIPTVVCRLEQLK
ncbi:hypothetical protein ABG067_007570, partial [Albugo candida]